jgi:hypothetical protein
MQVLASDGLFMYADMCLRATRALTDITQFLNFACNWLAARKTDELIFTQKLSSYSSGIIISAAPEWQTSGLKA